MADSETRRLDQHLFNEAYMMHSSTSPQYAIIASCDVAASMMEPPGGTALVEESILESMEFRRAMRKIDKDWGRDWWFQVWGPPKLASEGIGKRDDWMLTANEKWHGFGDLAPGFNMLDPIKSTIVTPGLDVTGKFAKTGIPAAIVTKYLAEHGVVVEKTGLYSFFIMFTIGITKGRWNTLLTALQQFKDDYDKNAPMWRVLPEFCQHQPKYERMGLRELSQSIHETYSKGDIARLTTEMYLSDLQPAMKPSEAFARIAHRDTERVPIEELEGRITTAMLTPYPPGIPLLIPGERFNRRIVEYLRFVQDFNARFPGFDTDVHGLVENETEGFRRSYYVDCVRSATAACGPAGSAGRVDTDAHLAEAAVDVDDLGTDASRQIRQQKRGGVADVVDRDVAADRRLSGELGLQLAEVLDARGGQRLDRAGRDAVDPHALGAQALRQEAHAGLERGLGQAHGVVVGHVAHRAQVAQRQQAPLRCAGAAARPWPWPESCRPRFRARRESSRG